MRHNIIRAILAAGIATAALSVSACGHTDRLCRRPSRCRPKRCHRNPCRPVPAVDLERRAPPMTTPPLVFIGAAAVERAASIEVLASAAYLHWCLHRAEESTWAHCTGVTRERYLEHAEMLADALAAAGRLPILCEERATWIAGDGHRAYDERPRSYWQKRLAWPDTRVESRYVTEWQERPQR